MKKPVALLAILLILGGAVHCTVNRPPASDYEYGTEYEDQVAEILATYTKDPISAMQELEALDTQLLSAPTAVEYPDAAGVEQAPSDYELVVFAFQVKNTERIYLQWILTLNTDEKHPGPLDYAGLEWDTDYGAYYSSSAGGESCTLAGRGTGLVLFNVEDINLSAGNYIYGTVQVEPITAGRMEFGSKFIHTYTSPGISGSATVSFTPSASSAAEGGSLGLPHTMSFAVDRKAGTRQRQIWADGGVDIPES